MSELARQYQVHPMQITKWRKAALEGLPEIFEPVGQHDSTLDVGAHRGPLDLTEQSRIAIGELIDVAGRATDEAVRA